MLKPITNSPLRYPKWLVTRKFHKYASRTPHLHRSSNLAGKSFKLINLHLIVKFPRDK